jgi:hypothetical protein
MADTMMRQLEYPLPARWILFTDFNQPRVRVHAKVLEQVREGTQDQRAADRGFRGGRHRAAQADRGQWEEDDQDR